jgi:hypothetical protein
MKNSPGMIEGQEFIEGNGMREQRVRNFLSNYHGMTWYNSPISFDSVEFSAIRIWWHFYQVTVKKYNNITNAKIVFSPAISNHLKKAVVVIVKMESEL